MSPEASRGNRGRAGISRRGLVLAAMVASSGLIAGAMAVSAHVAGSTGYASIAISSNTIRYALTLSPSALPPAIASDLARARAGAPDSRDRWLGYLRDKIRLADRGTACEPAEGHVEAERPDAEGITLVMHFACAAAVSELSIHDDVFDVLGADHHTLAKVEWPAGTQELAFEPAAREARVTIEGPADGDGHGAGFFRLGVLHILTGYDHLLFLAALLLRGGRLVSLLEIVTAFTIAHSITLALAALDLVVIPDRIVEPVIAASIVWVALENVVDKRALSRRWLVSFVFGLVHGFGFAEALRPLALPPAGMAWALLGFNLGVESGQAMVVIALLPLLGWMQGRQWEPRAVRAASLAVAAVGLLWLLERVFLV